MVRVVLIEKSAWRAFLVAHKVKAWYMRLGLVPRAFAIGQTIYVRADQLNNIELRAHELGHTRGLTHPPRFSVANLLDVMGESPIRILDEHDLKPDARKLTVESPKRGQ